MPEGRELAPAEQLRQGMLGSLEKKGKPLVEHPSTADESHDISLKAMYGDPEGIRTGEHEGVDPFFIARKEALAALQAARDLVQIAPDITNPELLAKFEKKHGLLVQSAEDVMTRALLDIEVTAEKRDEAQRRIDMRRAQQEQQGNEPTPPEEINPVELGQRIAEQTSRIQGLANSGNHKAIQNGMFPDLTLTFVSERLAFALLRSAHDLSILIDNEDDLDVKEKLRVVAKGHKTQASKLSASLVRDIKIEPPPENPSSDRNYL